MERWDLQRTGLITQEDPIGLAGGLHLYGFAGGVPVNFSDPFGLKVCGTTSGLRRGIERSVGAEITWDDSPAADVASVQTGLSELVRRYVAAAGIGKHGTCHLFRHTMATLMLERGAGIRDIQEMLGHADLSTTQRYTHVSIARLEQVHTRTHPARLTKEHGAALPLSADLCCHAGEAGHPPAPRGLGRAAWRVRPRLRSGAPPSLLLGPPLPFT